jgi:hypothetical protein
MPASRGLNFFIDYFLSWGDMDITDLKNLVEMTVGWIKQELITQQYVQDMPDDKK